MLYSCGIKKKGDELVDCREGLMDYGDEVGGGREEKGATALKRRCVVVGVAEWSLY